MTFENWLLEQGFKHPEFDLMVKHSEYALMKAAWNAAIKSVIYELGDQAYKDNYAYKNGDPEYAEDVAKRLLTS